MNPREVAEQLHENERRILLVLKENESASTSLLAEVTGLPKDAVEKACAWAETKGVLTFNEETTVKHSLTDEGKRYANGGLPEKNLLRFVAEGVNEINGLKEDFPALNIALVWIRRNEWATIEKGRLNPTQKGENALETQSEDVLASMLRSFLWGSGRMVEVAGEGALDGDIEVHSHEFARVVEEGYPQLSQDVRDLCEGFAAGVNRYMADHPDQVPDWATPVTPQDIVLLQKRFDFYRGDVFATHLEHVPDAAMKHQLAVRVDRNQVTGMEPAFVIKRLRGFLR